MAKKEPYKKFTVEDVHRIMDIMRIKHRASDHALLNAVLHAFGIKDVVCAAINALQLFQTVGLVSILLTLYKLLKGLIVIYNLLRGASIKIIKASLFMISLDLSTTFLSKIALRFTAFSAALDVLGAMLALYAELLVAFDPLVKFVSLVCDDESNFKTNSEPVLFALEALKITQEIQSKRNEVGDAIQIIDGVTQ